MSSEWGVRKRVGRGSVRAGWSSKAHSLISQSQSCAKRAVRNARAAGILRTSQPKSSGNSRESVLSVTQETDSEAYRAIRIMELGRQEEVRNWEGRG